MRFALYRPDQGSDRIAISFDDHYYDLQSVNPDLPKDMTELLMTYDSFSYALGKRFLSMKEALVPLSPNRLLPPIPNPTKLLCLGLNYFDHAAEVGAKRPVYPDIFAKFANTLIGSGDAIVMPAQSEQLDYEIELAVVIGRRCRNAKRSEALKFVAGYTIMNDISVRDIQLRSSQATMGKNFDTHGPCGPVIVTPEELTDPQRLDLRLTVNGEVRQQSNTEQMIFSVAEIIEYLSSMMTLTPGDMISTGTPAGTGISRKPSQWLRKGDHIEAEIEGIGILANSVV